MSLSKINVIIKDKLHMDKGIKETFPINRWYCSEVPGNLAVYTWKLKDTSMKGKLVHSVVTKRRCQICV